MEIKVNDKLDPWKWKRLTVSLNTDPPTPPPSPPGLAIIITHLV